MAALAKLAQGDEPLILKPSDPDINSKKSRDGDRGERRDRRNRGERDARGNRGGDKREQRKQRQSRPAEEGMQRYRIDVGHAHGAKPGNIVGAIANEANISSKHIGSIQIYDNYSTVDLPDGMPSQVKQTLQNTRVAGQRLSIREWSDTPPEKRRKK